MPAPTHTQGTEARLAVLWDESHLWGLMLVRALRHLGCRFELLRAEQVARKGLVLAPASALLVPGGWSAKKAERLGAAGLQAVRNVVRGGGSYLGFCGGAGFALSTGRADRCLGLCSWGRKPMQERLPNCSGHICLRASQGGALSAAAPDRRILAPVWWPSQFEPRPGPNQPRALASYALPARDFWVADLPYAQLPAEQLEAWEARYNINLRPEILAGEPALLSGRFGKGRYVLSYVHLETPGSPQANRWLWNLLRSLAPGAASGKAGPGSVPQWHLAGADARWDDPTLTRCRDTLLAVVQEGLESELICWRKPWLLGWKRGLPGFALNSLLAMLTEARAGPPSETALALWQARKDRFEEALQAFAQGFRALLAEDPARLEDGAALQAEAGTNGPGEVKRRLVGPFPGQEGLFGRLAADLEEVLWEQLRGPSGKGRGSA